ncbi:MAG: O-antigen ligase family protein [Verrucomicrobiota bacterium]
MAPSKQPQHEHDAFDKSDAWSDSNGANASERLLAWLPFILLFLAYPVALLVPVRLGIPLTYEWSLPILLGASAYCLAAVAGLVLNETLPARRIALSVLLAGVALPLLSTFSAARFDLRGVVVTAGYAGIPLYFAVCPKAWALPRRVSLVLAALWGAHVLHGLWQVGVGFPVVGVTGNRNWMAALTVALAPWPIVAAHEYAARRDSGRWLTPTIGLLTAPVVIFLAWHTRCRATAVALLAYALWWMFWAIPRRSRRAIFATAVGGVLLFGAWLSRDSLQAAAAEDIRLPCWRGTVAMIANSPWTGVGPGQYRREFPAYRSTALKQRLVAADITEHPHNQLLYLAATTGLPFAILWLVLIASLVAPPERGQRLRAVHFMTFMLVAHAMLDKQMVQPPTDLLACIGIGLLWRRPLCAFHGKKPKLAAGRCSFVGPALPLLALLAVVVVGLRVDLPAGTARRRARLAERNGDHRRAAREYVRAGHLTRNARDYLLAGMVATQQLDQPMLSLKLLAWAYDEEPYIGHLHRYLGLTLGRLGQHAVALEHFELESQLYPFHAANHQLLYNARIHCDILKGLPGLQNSIGDLRYRTAVNKLGESRLRQAATAWWKAVQVNRPKDAARIAHWMLEPLEANMQEPVPPGIAPPPADFRPEKAAAVTRQDFDLWRQWATTRPQASADKPASVAVVPAEFRCRNQALAQLAARALPGFPLTQSPSPASRLETAFINQNSPPSYIYLP